MASETTPLSQDPSYTTEAYDEEYYSGILQNKKFRSHHWRLKWLEECLAPSKDDRVIELGCGAGNITSFLAPRVKQVHAVDISELAVNTARRQCAAFRNATFQVADASAVPGTADASYDKAVSCDVTEHCGYDTMLGIFREAFRFLRPGGLYFVYTPNPLHWIERAKNWGILKQHPAHTGLRPAPEIIQALQKAGFEMATQRQPPSMIPVVNWFEKLWSMQPVFRQLGIYRIVLLARKPLQAAH
jgi:cyclopropane fatty-acyl-phospholipid synthase-like methyltransferase